MSGNVTFNTPDAMSTTTNLWHIPGWLGPTTLALHISGGQIGLLIVIVTSILGRKTVKQHPALISFCGSWILYSVSYCILLYARKAGKHVESDSDLCLTQAGLIHGTTSGTATAGVVLVYSLWRTQRQIGLDWRPSAIPPLHLLSALAIPVIVFTFFTVLTIAVGAHDRSIMYDNGLYCTLSSSFQTVVPAFCFAIMVLLLALQASLYVMWLQRRRVLKDLYPLHSPNEISISLCIRLGIFTIYSMLGLAASLIFLWPANNPFPYVVQASLPLAAAVIFGTRRELLRVWLFWNKKERKPMTRQQSMESMLPKLPQELEISLKTDV